MQKIPSTVLRYLPSALRYRLGLLTSATALLQITACLLLATVLNGVFLRDWHMTTAAPVLLVLFVVLAGKTGLTLIRTRLLRQLSLQVRQDIRQQLHRAALQPATSLAGSHALLTLALEATEALDGAVTQVLPNILTLLCGTPCLLIALWLLDWPTGLLALVTLPIAPLLLWLIGTVTQQRSSAAWQELNALSTAFGELLACLPTLKLFGQAARQGQRLTALSGRFSAASLAVLQVAFLSTFALELITTLAIALLAVSVGLRLLYGQLAFQTAFSVLLLAPLFYQPLRTSGAGFHAAMTAHTAWQKIKPYLQNAAAPVPSHHEQLRIPPAVQLQNLHYRYPHTAADALDLTDANIKTKNVRPARPDGDLTKLLSPVAAPPSFSKHGFLLPSGRITVITGPSGCGKSTLCRLLAGLAQPTQGHIMLEDQPLATMDAPSRAKIISYVPQEPHLYAATLRENLTLAFAPSKPQTLTPAITDQRCLQALRAAHLDHWYHALPQGLDTLLGAGDSAISQGERHRLGLARAFLQARPLVLLDEPTAGLDSATEQHVLEALKKFSYRRTVIIVSHRPAVLAMADCLLTLVPPTDSNPQGATTVPCPQADEPSSAPNEPDTTFAAFAPPSKATTPWGQMLTLLKPLSCLLLLTLSLLALALGLGLLGAAAWLIATAAQRPPLYTLTLGITAVRACGLGRAVARYGERYFTHRTAFHIQTHLHAKLYQRAAILLPMRSGPAQQGAFLHDLTTGSAELRDFYLRAMLPPLTLGLTTIFFTILLWPYLGLYALLMPLCYLLHLLWPALTSPNRTSTATRLEHNPGTSRTQEAHYRSTLLDYFLGRNELACAGHIAAALTRLNQSARAWQHLLQHRHNRYDLNDALLALTAQTTFVLLTAMLITCVSSGQLSGIGLAVWLILLLTLLDTYATLPPAVRQAQTALTAAKNILTGNTAEGSPARLNGDLTKQFAHFCASPRPCQTGSLLTVHDLSFGYQPAHPIIEHLSFTIAPGQHTALIGESGAGKTTLAQLIAAVWPPDSGTITRHGTVTVIPQGYQLFAASLRTNFIRLYPDITDKKIMDALTCAQLLPNDSVKSSYKNSSLLSGGQRSRLLTALTLASDAPLLILDEPTAGLDANTAERLLTACFAKVKQTHQTLLIITHDTAPIKYCAQIIKLHKS